MISTIALALATTLPGTYMEGEKKPRRELEPLPGATAAPEADEEPPHKWFTIAWLPLQALVPIGAISIEGRVADRWSVSLSGGYGSAPVLLADDKRVRRPAVLLGLLASYYVAGNFDNGGVHVGAAAQWTRIAGDGQITMSAVRPGLLVGPLLGFKWVMRGGFTLDSQIGIGFVAAETSGSKPNDPDQKTALLGNLGVGFTF